VGAGVSLPQWNICPSPLAYFLRYIRIRPIAHTAILIAVFAAVGCSVSTQYGLKSLVDALSAGPDQGTGVWIPFAVLVSLIAADSLMWRVASVIASFQVVFILSTRATPSRIDNYVSVMVGRTTRLSLTARTPDVASAATRTALFSASESTVPQRSTVPS
jgi:hypothetical protein